MHTATAYARRTRAALVAARITADTFTPTDDAAMRRLDRLTDYARRCEHLAYLAAGREATTPMRRAGAHADNVHAVSHSAGLLRGLHQRTSGGEAGLAAAMLNVRERMLTS